MNPNDFLQKILSYFKAKPKRKSYTDWEEGNVEGNSKSTNLQENEIQKSSIDLRCTVYINAQISHEVLRDQVCNLFNVSSDYYILFDEKADLWIKRNDGYFSNLTKEEKKDWINFPYLIYIDQYKDQTLEGQITLVTKLLEYLWSQDYSTIVSCFSEEFESFLPRNGNYNPISGKSIN